MCVDDRVEGIVVVVVFPFHLKSITQILCPVFPPTTFWPFTENFYRLLVLEHVQLYCCRNSVIFCDFFSHTLLTSDYHLQV